MTYIFIFFFFCSGCFWLDQTGTAEIIGPFGSSGYFSVTPSCELCLEEITINDAVITYNAYQAAQNDKGAIRSEQFSDEVKEIKIHGHCHQKALSTVEATFAMLNLPVNNTVTIYNSGCCGMAGSFGYEEEHYEISMQMGEDTLFPKIRATDQKVAIATAGTSCRHQIFDGTSRTAQHPVTILKSCLK